MDSIKSLLGAALQRHQITRQVTTSRILEVANQALLAALPNGHASDANAVFVRDGSILVHCRHAAAASLIASKERGILDAVKRALPAAAVDRIQTRIGV